MALLELHNVSKSFRNRKGMQDAVKNVSFSIEEGTSLALAGESGSGKSTIARIVSRLIREDQGSILFKGENLSEKFRLKPIGRPLQMIFQNPQDSFDPRDTVLDGVMQGARAYNMFSPGELEKKAMELFDYVGLKRTYKMVKVSELSGGECQRVAIARALIAEPQLLICDEATSSLDTLVQAQIVALLKKLKEDKSMTILFITHDLQLAADFCDGIVVMHQGEVVETGEISKVLENPTHEVTRKLLKYSLTIPEGNM